MKIEIDELVLQHNAAGPPLLSLPRIEVAAGERVLLRGASGSGKSSLLHVLAGLTVAHRGDVRLDGVSLRNAPERERSRLRRERIGFVFQRLNILEHLTAAENIELGAPGRRLDSARVQAALARVALDGYGARPTWQFSLGEQQRVAVARVLATRPALIIADEPTSSLDEANAKRVIEALLEAAEGVTLIVATHDPRVVEHFPRHWTVREGALHDTRVDLESAGLSEAPA